MQKCILKDGTPAFAIKLELLVTKKIFARAIAAYCFEKKVNFDPLSSKTQVAAILKAQLRWHGQSG